MATIQVVEKLNLTTIEVVERHKKFSVRPCWLATYHSDLDMCTAKGDRKLLRMFMVDSYVYAMFESAVYIRGYSQTLPVGYVEARVG